MYCLDVFKRAGQALLLLLMSAFSFGFNFTNTGFYISSCPYILYFQSYYTVDLIKHVWDTRQELRLKTRFRGLADDALAFRDEGNIQTVTVLNLVTNRKVRLGT